MICSFNRIKFAFALVFIFGYGYTIHAQILTVKPLEETESNFSTYTYFNPLFIQRNKVKEIKVEISYKVDQQPIEKSLSYEHYLFDSVGKLTKQTEIINIPFANRKDTIYIAYKYDSLSHVIEKTKYDATSEGTYEFKYDAGGHKTHILYKTREYQPLACEWRTYIIFEEKLEYEKRDHELIINTFNDIGKNYKTESIVFDKENRMDEYKNNLVMSGKGTMDKYYYDEFGRISKKEKIELPNNNELETINYAYDAHGNLLSEEIINDKIIKYKKEFLYDQNLLLSAILIRQEEAKSIKIMKFKYGFY